MQYLFFEHLKICVSRIALIKLKRISVLLNIKLCKHYEKKMVLLIELQLIFYITPYILLLLLHKIVYSDQGLSLQIMNFPLYFLHQCLKSQILTEAETISMHDRAQNAIQNANKCFSSKISKKTLSNTIVYTGREY